MRMRVIKNAIIVDVLFNDNFVVPCILDTGDAIGPVFTKAVADALQLPNSGVLGVSGAGGSTSAYSTFVDVQIDGYVWRREPAAIDDNLQGECLIGLPFFIRNASQLTIDFAQNKVTLNYDE